MTFTAENAGTYYVAAGAYGSREGTYTLSVEDVEDVPDDFSVGIGTSGAVEVGGSATGDIEIYGDRDWFAVTLEAGRTYRIDLEGSPTGNDTLSDSYLYGVHDANGDLIAGTTDDDGGAGRNSRVDFTAEEDATYYVAAGAYGSREGTYTLSVMDITNGVPDDFAAGIGTSGAVAVGGSATGDIEFEGDRDWFAVTLEAGRTYRIDLEGSPTGDGALGDPYLYGVHDANGDLIAGTTDDNGGEGRNSQVDVHGAGCRRLLCGGRRPGILGRQLYAVGGRGHVRCAAPARAGCGTSSSPATTISATRHSSAPRYATPSTTAMVGRVFAGHAPELLHEGAHQLRIAVVTSAPHLAQQGLVGRHPPDDSAASAQRHPTTRPALSGRPPLQG